MKPSARPYCPVCIECRRKMAAGISPEAVSYLSEVMDIPTAYINEVLSFYTMYNTRPVGKLHIQVCCNLSCAMNGSRDLWSIYVKTLMSKKGK